MKVTRRCNIKTQCCLEPTRSDLGQVCIMKLTATTFDGWVGISDAGWLLNANRRGTGEEHRAFLGWESPQHWVYSLWDTRDSKQQACIKARATLQVRQHSAPHCEGQMGGGRIAEQLFFGYHSYTAGWIKRPLPTWGISQNACKEKNKSRIKAVHLLLLLHSIN